MFTSAHIWRVTWRTVFLATCLGALALPDVLAQAPTTPVRALPNALLSIDQNRTTVIERIVAEWGDELARSGVNAGQLRLVLEGMRADQLLAASLAGSLDGLLEVVAPALSDAPGVSTLAKPAPGQVKALGDAGQDVTYTPVTPCRLVETRGTFAAVYQGDGSASHTPVPFSPNEIRSYTVQGGNGVCLTQLPPGLNPAAVQLQVFGMPTTTLSGDIEILPQGATFGSTATMVYLGSVAFNTVSTAATINLADNQISVQVRGGGANLALDVVGYFAAPATTALECTQVTGPNTSIAVSADTLVALPNCTSGYTRTGSSCSGTANIPGGYLVETNATGCLFRNLSAVATYAATATSTCCRIPGR